jgi:hypothetical protein
LKKEQVNENGTILIYYWISEKKLPGYYLPLKFIDPNTDEEMDYFYIGAYRTWLDEVGVAKSLPGKVPTTRLTRSDYRTAARKNDGDGNNIDSK